MIGFYNEMRECNKSEIKKRNFRKEIKKKQSTNHKENRSEWKRRWFICIN